MPLQIPQLPHRPGFDAYCVIGNPVAHSLSPRIHQAFAEQTGQPVDYHALQVDVDGFAGSLRALREQGLSGASITLPFKHEAWALCAQRSARAERSGAVNTISFSDEDLIVGDNTDGVGLLRDLRDNLNVTLKGRDILILGAGGAVAGVVEPLLDEKPANLVIANRSVDKAEAISRRFAAQGPVTALGYEGLSDRVFPVIINGTSLSLQDLLPPLPAGVMQAQGFAYDMMYRREPTCFMRWARAQGAADCADGLGMLVEQAAEAFAIWRGVHPETRPVLAQLRA